MGRRSAYRIKVKSQKSNLIEVIISKQYGGRREGTPTREIHHLNRHLLMAKKCLAQCGLVETEGKNYQLVQ